MNWLRSQFRSLEALYRWWRNHLTVGGKTLTVVLLACTPAIAAFDTPLFLLFAALLSLLVTVAWTSRWLHPQMTAHVVAAESVPCGDALELSVHVTNVSQVDAYDLSLELVGTPASWRLAASTPILNRLGAQGTAKLTFTVHPTQRGVFAYPSLRVTSTFPLNLFRRWRDVSLAGEIAVLPDYRPLAAFDLSHAAAEHMDEQLATTVAPGHSGEYFGSREFVAGLPFRRWDYASWARLGQPAVREYTEPQHPTVAILIDTRTSRQAKPYDRLEAQISLAAAISEALAQRNWRIAFVATASNIFDLSGVPLSHQHDDILRELAAIEPTNADGTWDALNGLDETTLPPLGFAILSSWDHSCERMHDYLAVHGCDIRRVFIDPTPEINTVRQLGDIEASLAAIQNGSVEIR